MRQNASKMSTVLTLNANIHSAAGCTQAAWFLGVAFLLLTSCAGLRPASSLDHLKPCASSEGPSDAYCGSLEVWENRTTKAGRKIRLKIVVLPALKQDYARDPVFFLAGGPGQGAAELAEAIQEPYRRIQSSRDIVLVDQRGTGKSNPLECKPPKDAEEDSNEDPMPAMLQRLRGCLASYQGKADVRQYTTPIAMDDLDEVRQYLGYSRINLYGGSYGTRAAIVYVRRHRESTRAVIIDGVAPPDILLPLYMARDSQRALGLLFRDCEKDVACAHRFPHLQDRFQALIDRLTAHPEHVRYVDPRSGEEKDLDAKRLTVTGSVFAALYSPLTSSLLPLLIEQAEKGNFTGFLALGAAFDPTAASIAQGMHFSVVCSEDATGIPAGAVAKEAANTFLGTEFTEDRLKPCEFWPKGSIDAAYFDNTPSDVPALILSGELDPVTPPVWGQQIAAVWKNSRHIVVPHTGHGTWASGCVLKLMSQFLNEGSAANLDASCVNRIERPPFFLGPAGPDPMTGASK
jgi:pimeloyl-ACP methyl ester carboxylesterase